MPINNKEIEILASYAQEIRLQSKDYLWQQIRKHKKMISFAQNYEDVYLKRLFPYPSSLTYVDVGAADPFIHSVTAWFYLTGSTGLNIDADERSYIQLCNYRPLDHNVCAFVGKDNGERIFVAHPVKSRSTGRNEYIDYDLFDKKMLKRKTLRAQTLAEILENHKITPGFSLLKLDCEGSELEIANSFDFLYFKPQIVIIETAKPYDMTSECKMGIADHSEEINEEMTKAGYYKVLFDGVNTWFAPMSSAKAVANTLGVPIGAHDRFVPFLALQFVL